MPSACVCVSAGRWTPPSSLPSTTFASSGPRPPLTLPAPLSSSPLPLLSRSLSGSRRALSSPPPLLLRPSLLLISSFSSTRLIRRSSLSSTPASVRTVSPTTRWRRRALPSSSLPVTSFYPRIRTTRATSLSFSAEHTTPQAARPNKCMQC